MNIKLFVKKGCNKCDYLKPYLTSSTKVFDVDTLEGSTELALSRLIDLASNQLPILEVEGNIIIGAIPIKRFLLTGRV